MLFMRALLEKYGKLYSCNSQIHINHSFSELDFREGFHIWINMTTENLANVYKSDLKMPENCKSVTFLPIKIGDRAFPFVPIVLIFHPMGD